MKIFAKKYSNFDQGSNNGIFNNYRMKVLYNTNYKFESIRKCITLTNTNTSIHYNKRNYLKI